MVQDRYELVSRRSVFKTATQALVATSIFATGAKATDSETDDEVYDESVGISLDEDKLVYDESNDLSLETHEETESVDLDESVRSTVDALNEAREDGEVTFEERDGEVWVVSDGMESDEASVLCGTNDYTSGSTSRGPYHVLKLDDGLSRDVAALMAAGAAAGVIATKISASIGAVPVAVVSMIAGILSGLGALLIHENNDGCGVKIRHYPHLPEVPGVGITFRPQ
ncbi:hypothetical protein [Natrarchaeobius oligotrophus]|uniref:Uncharacterized protein n=1 Tax=Natrarchaeobius chitinivorans TaxID=1679083 RepID=A0A3N6MH91_NATCH|nr:hypothetical protein [Natrarchaeobius chitinivorans]RQH03399.1 hypothetical protein EA472_02215 [Natrarchaeobius chitinivorans]